MLHKEELIDIYEDTFDFCLSNKLYANRSVRYTLEAIEQEFNKVEKTQNKNAKIEVVLEDTLVTSSRFERPPLVLNFASDFVPGGGVRKGSMAQEEELFRRTNYFTSLSKRYIEYPLMKNELVYTPTISIIKDRDYNYIETPFKIFHGVACAAIRNPEVLKGAYKNKTDKDLMTRKIEAIFQLGIIKNLDVLILGAFGCGAFRNPPREIIAIFNSMIKKYKGYFSNIVFSVLGDENFNLFNTGINKVI